MLAGFDVGRSVARGLGGHGVSQTFTDLHGPSRTDTGHPGRALTETDDRHGLTWSGAAGSTDQVIGLGQECPRYRKWPIRALWLLVCVAGLVFAVGCTRQPPLNENGEPVELRVGYFPNVTHGQAIIGMARGDFQKAVGPGVKIVPQTFNAGPSAIEALYAGHIDITYVGPSPALNGYIQSKGEEVRVIAGSAVNGVTVVGSRARGITELSQLKGGRIATPQYANTQDISARYFLGHKYGFSLSTDGGDTDIIPISNPDIETLFMKNQIDGAWVPEPWGTRLIQKNLVNEIVKESELWPDKSFVITTIIARREILEKYPELVSRFLEAHIRLTGEFQQDAQKFVPQINDELKRITGKALDEQVLRGAIANTGFSYDPSPGSFVSYFQMACDVGIFIDKEFDVAKLLFTKPLLAAEGRLGLSGVISASTLAADSVTTIPGAASEAKATSSTQSTTLKGSVP